MKGHKQEVLIIESLELLAASANDQIAYLEAHGIPGIVDELALNFGDSAGLFDELHRKKYLTEEQYLALRSVDEQLDAMSGANQHDLWAPTSLQKAQEWSEVRRLASIALQSLR